MFSGSFGSTINHQEQQNQSQIRVNNYKTITKKCPCCFGTRWIHQKTNMIEGETYYPCCSATSENSGHPYMSRLWI